MRYGCYGRGAYIVLIKISLKKQVKKKNLYVFAYSWLHLITTTCNKQKCKYRLILFFIRFLRFVL